MATNPRQIRENTSPRETIGVQKKTALRVASTNSQGLTQHLVRGGAVPIIVSETTDTRPPVRGGVA